MNGRRFKTNENKPILIIAYNRLVTFPPSSFAKNLSVSNNSQLYLREWKFPRNPSSIVVKEIKRRTNKNDT